MFILLALTLSACGQNLPAPSSTPSPSPTFGPIGPENAAYLEEVQRFGKGTLNGLAWSPDGSTLAAAGALGVYLYDPQSGQELAFVETSAAVSQAIFSPDGTRLAAAQTDGQINLWQLVLPGASTAPSAATPTGTPQPQILPLRNWEAHAGPVQALAFSPDGRQLASGGTDGSVLLWEISTGRKLEEYPAPSVAGLAFHPDGNSLAVALFSGSTLRLLSLPQGEILMETSSPGATGPSLQFTPDGSRLLSCGAGQGMKLSSAILWEVSNGALAQRLAELTARPRAAALSPDGSWIATGDDAGRLTLWTRQPDGDYEQFETWQAHKRRVIALAFSPGGTRLASLSSAGQLILWNAITAQPVGEILGHSAPLLSAALSPDGSLLATAGQEKEISLWNLDSGTIERQIEGGGAFLSLAFSPEGAQLAASSSLPDYWLRVYDPFTGKQTAALDEAPGELSAMVFDPQSRRLLLASPAASAIIQAWDYELGDLKRLNLPTQPHARLAFDARGRSLLVAAQGQPLHLWEPHANLPLVVLDPLNFEVRSLALSPDGFTAALGSAAGGEVWNLRARAVAFRLDGLGEAVDALAFSPDGRLLLAASAPADGDSGSQGLDLWALPEGRLVTSLPLPHGRAVFAAFSPDGQSIVTAGTDGVVRIFRLAPRPGPTRTVRPSATPTATATATATPTPTPYALNSTQAAPVRLSNGPMEGVALSPDGNTLAVSSPERLELYDLSRFPLVPTGSIPLDPFPQDVYSEHQVAFSPDGRWIVVTQFREIVLIDAVSGEKIRTLDPGYNPLNYLHFTPDSRYLVAGGYYIDRWDDYAALMIFDLDTGDTVLSLQAYPETSAFSQVAVSPDGQYLATDGLANELEIRTIADGEVAFSLSGIGSLSALVFTPDGRQLITAGRDASLSAWDYRSGRRLSTYWGFPDDVDWLGFDAAGGLLANDTSSGLYQAALTGSLLPQALGLPPGDVLAYLPERWLLMQHADGAVLWQLGAAGWQPAARLDSYGSFWGSQHDHLVFSPDGRTLAAFGFENGNSIRLWDPAGGPPETLRTPSGGEVTGLAFSPDGKILAASSWEDGLLIWETATRRLLYHFPDHSSERLAFSPDGGLLALRRADRALLELWRIGESQPYAVLINPIPGGEIAFINAGQTLVVFDRNGVQSWRMPDGAPLELLELEEVPGLVTSDAFISSIMPGADGLIWGIQKYSSYGDDDQIKVWDAQWQRLLADISYSYRGMIISPDGRWLVTRSGLQMQVWDWSSERIVLTLPVEELYSQAFSPDGRWLAGSTEYGALITWDFAALLQAAGQAAQAPLPTLGTPTPTASPTPSPATATPASQLSLPEAFPAPDLHPQALSPGRLPAPAPLAQQGAGRLRHAAWSPDGSQVAVGGSAGIILLAADTFSLTQQLDTGASVTALAYSPDGARLAAGTTTGRLLVWEMPAGELRHAIQIGTNSVSSLVFNPQGTLLAVSSSSIQLVELDSGEISLLTESRDDVVGFTVDQQGVWIYDGYRFRLWDIAQGIITRAVNLPAYCRGPSPIIKGRISTACNDGYIYLWRLDSGSQLISIDYDANSDEIPGYLPNPPPKVAYSPNGAWLATARNRQETLDQIITVIDARSGATVWQEILPRAETRELVFSPDSQRFISLHQDGEIVLWDVSTGQRLAQITHYQPVQNFAFFADGRLAAWQPHDLFFFTPGQSVQPDYQANFPLPDSILAFHPGSQVIASLNPGKNQVELWSAEDRVLQQELKVPEDFYYESFDIYPDASSSVFNPPGDLLAIENYWSTWIWDLKAGNASYSLKLDLASSRFSPFSRMIAAYEWGILQIWDPTARRILLRYDIEYDPIIAFGPGNLLAAANGNSIEFFHLGDRRRLAKLFTPAAQILDIAFSPDGRLLAVYWAEEIGLYSMDSLPSSGRVFVYDQPLMRLPVPVPALGYTDAWHGLGFSPDGRWLVLRTEDGVLLVWGAAQKP